MNPSRSPSAEEQGRRLAREVSGVPASSSSSSIDASRNVDGDANATGLELAQDVASDTSVSAPLSSDSEDADEQKVAQAAYFKALDRGFEPGHELEDWLAAERELKGTRS